MNKYNLIQFGSLAQKEFGMADDFTIMEVSSDNPNVVRIAVPDDFLRHDVAQYDEVHLKKYGTKDNFEHIYCGYSKRANVLVIREVDRSG
ncbi:MAG: hypothetical protein HN916_18370 [Anaerolineae bacterium]|jgi:hypothetical protein|nr:hypothetical protein [Anaerolineae bacterium]MBT7991045.1 hypothetical protein [Anaerolineae bacterium]